MQIGSTDFEIAVADSHRVAARATLEDGTELPIDSGTVTLSQTSATRAAVGLDLAIDDLELESWVPTGPDSLLAPYGNEFTVERGIVHPDGYAEYLPLGVFRIDEVDVSEGGISLSGLDRSTAVIEAVFENAGQIASGTNCGTAIQNLILQALPTQTFDFDTTSVTLPLIAYEQGDDRWDACQAIAEACGMSLYFSATGVLTLRYQPPSSTPALTVSEGEGGILVGASKTWNREDAVNRVVVTGENSDTDADPPWAEALDDDPDSPTYYYGDFGKCTFSYGSTYLTTAADCQTTADRILDLKLGTGQRIEFESLVHPGLEPLDTVLVVRDRLGINELHVIDTVSIPLGPEGSMACSTRVARVN